MNKDIYKRLLDMSENKDYESNKKGNFLGATEEETEHLKRLYNKDMERKLMDFLKGKKNFLGKDIEHNELGVDTFDNGEFVDEFLKKRKFKVIEDMKK